MFPFAAVEKSGDDAHRLLLGSLYDTENTPGAFFNPAERVPERGIAPVRGRSKERRPGADRPV